MASVKSSEKVMDRREAIIGIVGGVAVISAYIITAYNSARIPLPKTWDTSRTIGERAIPIPNSWINNLERISIDARELSKSNIDTLTRTMQPIDYSRVCKSNPGVAMPTTKYGMSLPDAMERIGKKAEPSSGLTRVESTDWYTLVPEDAKKVFLSISKTNIPKKYWQEPGFSAARKSKVTYPGVFFPEESAQAWKDLVDVKDISALKEEVNPGTYFRGPDGKIVMPEQKDVSMSLDKLVLMIQADNGFYMRVDYSDIKQFAEESFIKRDNKLMPYLRLQDILEGYHISYKNKAFIFHGNNYAASIPPWRQKDLGIVFDEKYEKKFGVPTKLIGGEFLNKAAQVGGFYRIDIVPMPG